MSNFETCVWFLKCSMYFMHFISFYFVCFLIREMEWRLDKEGREYHHYEDFCKLYRSEILNLNRMLDMLSKSGMLPGNLNLNFSVSNVSILDSPPIWTWFEWSFVGLGHMVVELVQPFSLSSWFQKVEIWVWTFFSGY